MKVLQLGLALVLGAMPVMAQNCVPAVKSPVTIAGDAVDNGTEHVCPLTVGEKAGIFARHTVHPFNFVAAAASAGISQATQKPHTSFGQGWGSYGERFGAALLNRETGDFFKTFLLPSAFHTDPRYFRQVTGSTGSRLGHALSSVLVTRTDSGGRTFNAAEVLGTGASAAISNAYYPESDRTAGRTLETFGLNIAADAAWNILKEFAPDILHRKRK